MTAWASATAACREVSSYAAELRAGGRVDGQRVAGLTLGVALERAGRLAIDARYGGASVFVLRGSTDDATIVLPRDGRVATGSAEAILDALVGIPLGPARLLAVLTGCVSTTAVVRTAEQVDSVGRVRTDDAEVYLARTAAGWRVRAGTFDGFTVDYRRVASGSPTDITIRSMEGRRPAVDLSLRVVVVDTTPRAPSVFTPVVPSGATRITIDALRDDGPLGPRR